MRSLDDGDIYRRDPANVVIHHPMNSASYSATGGGTLPRPKGMVKPRPVAKIVANARDNAAAASLCDVDPKSMKMNSSFSPLHTPKKMSTIRSDSYEGQVHHHHLITFITFQHTTNDFVARKLKVKQVLMKVSFLLLLRTSGQSSCSLFVGIAATVREHLKLNNSVETIPT